MVKFPAFSESTISSSISSTSSFTGLLMRTHVENLSTFRCMHWTQGTMCFRDLLTFFSNLSIFPRSFHTCSSDIWGDMANGASSPTSGIKSPSTSLAVVTMPSRQEFWQSWLMEWNSRGTQRMHGLEMFVAWYTHVTICCQPFEIKESGLHDAGNECVNSLPIFSKDRMIDDAAAVSMGDPGTMVPFKTGSISLRAASNMSKNFDCSTLQDVLATTLSSASQPAPATSSAWITWLRNPWVTLKISGASSLPCRTMVVALIRKKLFRDATSRCPCALLLGTGGDTSSAPSALLRRPAPGHRQAARQRARMCLPSMAEYQGQEVRNRMGGR
mmetsp:Transcript_44063/g.137186  ORF Transcript_44063/g.137186 Transcript_44063/m.137186 type:complete len:329 (-) Transcript_44063:22-1008(-)